MNILPKKRWHVRSKENIARVRRDEAKAAEEEKAKEERIKLAESESRLKLLKKLAKEKYGNKSSDDSSTEVINQQNDSATITEESGHINFFSNIEDANKDYKKANAEHEKEKKEAQEKYEKQIGYLTYLGQDTNEALGKTSWYNTVPDRSNTTTSEINIKTKLLHDPLSVMKKYLDPKKDDSEKSKSITEVKSPDLKSTIDISDNDSDVKRSKKNIKKDKNKRKRYKHKKSKKQKQLTSSSSSDTDECDKVNKRRKLELLRAERLKREREERIRAEKLLAKVRGDPPPEEKIEKPTTAIKQKYNSQFNPDIAKQNYDFYPNK